MSSLSLLFHLMHHRWIKVLISFKKSMISEGSCDTEDWSNDAENHRNKLQLNRYSHKKHLF